MAQAKALVCPGQPKICTRLAQLRHQFRLIAETQQLSPKKYLLTVTSRSAAYSAHS